MSNFIKAERVVATALGLLLREQTLPQLVWRDAVGDFAGAKGDAVTIRLPAYAPARARALRSGDTRIKDQLFESKLVLDLTTDVYKDIPITDEELTLDIVDFSAQVLNPVLVGIAERNELEIANVINDAPYYRTITHDLSADDVQKTTVTAKQALDAAYVPGQGRVLLVGSSFEAALLMSDKLVHADKSGSTETLRDGMVGRISGFTVVSSPMIADDTAIAFHRTAFAMANRAPRIPDSIKWGATQSFQGYAIRVVKSFDHDRMEERFIADSWVGANHILDDGFYVNNRFVPATEPGVTLADQTAVTGESDDELFTATNHGLRVGDTVKFPSLTGGTGLSTATKYYVIASGLTANTFRVSTTAGGATVNYSSDVTAGSVAQLASPKLTRAVKIQVVD